MSTSQSTHLTTAEPWTTDNRYKLRLESSQIYREIKGKYLFTEELCFYPMKIISTFRFLGTNITGNSNSLKNGSKYMRGNSNI